MFVCAQAAVALSPLAGRGRGEGASRLDSELRRSESRRGPLTLLASLVDLSPHAGRGESYVASADLPFSVAEGNASQHSAPPLSSDRGQRPVASPVAAAA